MNATDLHAAALARLAELRAVVAEGTPGEWLPYSDDNGNDEWVLYSSEVGHDFAEFECERDARTAAAAVNLLPKMLDAAEAGLARHAPYMVGMWEQGCEANCSTTVWPCPDARGWLNMLEVEHG